MIEIIVSKSDEGADLIPYLKGHLPDRGEVTDWFRKEMSRKKNHIITLLTLRVFIFNNRGNKMLKDLVRLANHLDSKGLLKEADALDKVIRASLDDAPSYFEDSDLPVASKYKEPALYAIIANRAIGRGEGTIFAGLQESVYNNLKAQKLLSDESDSPMGPFTAKDIEVIASVISDSLKKDFRSVIFPELAEDVKDGRQRTDEHPSGRVASRIYGSWV